MSERVEMVPLLPGILRARDFERGEPLRALIELIEEQARVVEAQVAGFYDDLFVETCADWVVPYIGDLVGSATLHEAVVGRRADVAHTIGYRRRKGVVPMLEQLARDVTGWDAHVVPAFELLGLTQNDDHVRRARPGALTLGGFVPPPASERVGTANVRDRDAMDRLVGPFEGTVHTVDVRRPSRDEGRYGIRNALVFLWRLGAFPLQRTTASKVAGDPLRWTFSSLGADTRLFSARQPVPDSPGIVTEHNVGGPVRTLAFSAAPSDWYGDDASFVVHGVAPALVMCKDLSNWTAPPVGRVAIDVKRGRIMFGANVQPQAAPNVSYRYGFSARLGGGPYPRERGRDRPPWVRADREAGVDPVADADAYGTVIRVGPGQQATVQAAVGAWNPGTARRTVIEVEDSGTYALPAAGLTIPAAPAGTELVIQARNRVRPTLTGDLVVASTQLARLVLDGFLIAGTITLQGELAELSIRHCTLVPGVTLKLEGAPGSPAAPSLAAAASARPRSLIVERSITGPLRVPAELSELAIRDSIVDAPERTDGKPRVALAAPPSGGLADGKQPGPATKIERSTVLGLVHVQELSLGSSSIFAAGPLICERRQQGCLRFSSFEPGDSRTPRRFRCQPDLALESADSGADLDLVAAGVRPRFSSDRYGTPAYVQLADGGPAEIAAGGDEGSEMGAFHHLYQPQREANLRMRLEEYLPFGLEPGLIHVT
jgi:hypothetical protein